MKIFKFFVPILLFMCSGAWEYPENLGILHDMLTPEGIEIFQDEIFIIQGATIFVYDKNDLKLLRKFGREGEGPGELQVTPWLSNTMNISENSITVGSVNKMIIFSIQGEVLKEKRRSEQFTQMVPVGKNFAVRKRLVEDEKQYTTINCYIAQEDKTRELYRQPFAPGQGLQMNMIPDSIHFIVYKEKIYIEKSPEGFVMDVFDSTGTKLYQIKNKYAKVKLTKKDREEAEKNARTDPFIKSGPGGWEQWKKQYRLLFPKTFPPFQDFLIADDKIYVQTYKRQESKEEYIIMDLTGTILSQIFLPMVRKPTYTEQMMGTGVRLYAFHNDSFYYIVEHDKYCELHEVKINP